MANPITPPTDTGVFGPGPVASLIKSTKTLPGKHKGMVKQGNIDLLNRPVAHNQDGSVSTVRSISIGVGKHEVLIPTVINGKVVSNQAAIDHYKKTGEHLGVFSSPETANSYAMKLHEQQQTMYPTPALQPYGVHLDINQVNDRVQQITDAHLQKFGYNPRPGLVFDLLKGEALTGPLDYSHLFNVPSSRREAAASLATRYTYNPGDLVAALPVVEPSAKQLVQGMSKALAQDRKNNDLAHTQYNAWVAANKDYLQTAFTDPTDRETLMKGALDHGGIMAGPQMVSGITTNLSLDPLAFRVIDTYAAKPLAQIVNSTTDMPYGFYRLARGIGLDAFDLSTVPMHTLGQPFGIDVRVRPELAHHTEGLAAAMYQSVLQDINHPIRNEGYLIMDIWAAASLAAGTAARVSRVAAAEGAAAKLRAVAFKGEPRSTRMGFSGEAGAGGYWESLPLSDTTIVRILQQKTPFFGREARQKRLTVDQAEGLDEGSQAEFINQILGTESSLRRATERRVQIEAAVQLTPVTEMLRLQRADFRAKGALGEIMQDPSQLKSYKRVQVKQKIGVEKALQVLFTDDADPVNMWRVYHERTIKDLTEAADKYKSDLLEGLKESDPSATLKTLEKDRSFKRATRSFDYSINAHHAQLEALQLADEILRDPPKRFLPLLDRAYEVAGKQEEWKKIMTGVDEQVMESHIAQVAAVARGENVISVPAVKEADGVAARSAYKAVSDVPVDELMARIDKRTNTMKNAQDRLKRAQGALRLHPSRADFKTEVENAQKAVDRHNKILGGLQQRLSKIQEAATPLERKVTAENAGEVGPLDYLREGGPGSAYFPTFPEKYREKAPKVRSFVRPSKYGLRPTKFPLKTWTGDSLTMGDFRWDMTNLLAEQFTAAYHGMQTRVQWQDLWDSASQEKLSGHHMPIRDIASIPDDLREVVQAMERAKLDHRLDKIVTDANLRKLKEFLYPSVEEAANIPHVKWVDERLVMNKLGRYDTAFWQNVDNLMNNVMAPINEPMRMLLIFATPAYAMNALGSASLLMIKDGFLAPFDLGRAIGSSRIYGPEVTRLLDRLAGQTFTSSLVSERNWWTKGSQAAMEGWQHLTDIHFRRAAVIHELRRAGLLKEETNQGLYEMLTSEDHEIMAKINQASQTARKAMLDFNRMSWPERATLRHIFFVYSFVRASGIWSLRFLRDHGFMADVLAQEGKGRTQNIDELIGHMPDWFMRAGYFALQPDVVHNPIQWNMPGMLAQITSPLSAMFGHTPYATPSELLGPATQMGYGVLTGKDTQGRDLPKPGSTLGQIPGSQGTIGRSFLGLWQQTPFGYAAIRKKKAEKQAQQPLAPEGITSGYANPISPALARERSALNESVLKVDGFWNQMGLTLLHSAKPRGVNALAGEARYWRDLRQTDPQKYHQHELDAVHAMVKRQEGVLGRPAPVEVTDAVDMVAHVSQAIEDYKDAHRGEPSLNQKTIDQITLDALSKKGLVKDKPGWEKRIRNAIDPAGIQAIQTQLLDQAGGKAWRDWADQVRTVDGFAQPKFTAALQRIGGFPEAQKASQEARWAYGRQVKTYLDARKRVNTTVARRDLANENDKPLSVNGVSFPSPVQALYALRSDQERADHLISISKAPWANLTSFDKELLGKKVDPKVASVWKTYTEALKEGIQSLPAGHRTASRKDRLDYARQLDGFYKAGGSFYKDVQFSQQPLFQRLGYLSTIQKSAFSDQWKTLLRFASEAYSLHKKDPKGYPIGALRDQWKDYVKSEGFQSWLGKSKGFKAELDRYNVLSTLLN